MSSTNLLSQCCQQKHQTERGKENVYTVTVREIEKGKHGVECRSRENEFPVTIGAMTTRDNVERCYQRMRQ